MAVVVLQGTPFVWVNDCYWGMQTSVLDTFKTAGFSKSGHSTLTVTDTRCSCASPSLNTALASALLCQGIGLRNHAGDRPAAVCPFAKLEPGRILQAVVRIV